MNNNNSISNLAKVLVLILITLAFIKFFDISYPIKVVNTTQVSELSVVGEGKVEVVPDTAYIDLGIAVNNAASVDEAQKQINSVSDKIVVAMKKLSIDKENIKTTNYSIYPNYAYEGGTNRIDGYNGNVTITIKVKDPKLAGRVVTVGTESGANQVQGTRFVVDDPSKYREEARAKAINNAKTQAKKIAGDLGIGLGKVTNIVESYSGSTSPLYSSRLSAASEGLGGAGGADNSFQQGSQTVTSTVTLYFEKR